jgi:hypothetical protein
MKRHDLDLVSLVAGLVFAVVATTHLVGAATGDYLDLRWVAPMLLVGLGAAGLAGVLRSLRPSDASESESDPNVGAR